MGAAAEPPVVVGIGDDFHGQRTALRFAAVEAVQRNAHVRLVHGCTPAVALRSGGQHVCPADLQRHAQHVLWSAARYLEWLVSGGELEVEQSPHPGTAIEALLQESAEAGLMVLQRRDIPALQRFSTGSTTSSVAARAACPVAVVRTEHGDAEHRSAVLVGVDADCQGSQVLHVAFEEAALRHTTLTVLHGLDEVRCHRPLTVDQIVAERRRLTDRLADLVSIEGKNFPQVVAHTGLVDDSAVSTLLNASRYAQLLVVGRSAESRTGEAWSGSLALGSLARRCLNLALCPVVVTAAGVRVPPPREGDDVTAAAEST